MSRGPQSTTKVCYYEPGVSRAEATRPGDFILTHRDDPYAKIIRLGQHMRFHGEDRKYAYWSHAALVVGYEGEIIECLARGISTGTLEKYRDVEYQYVDTSAFLNDADRDQAAAFAYAMVGQRYAWVTIASLSFQILTPSTITWVPQGAEMCSGFVSRGLERGSFLAPKVPQSMMPADLGKFFNVVPATSGVRR